VQLLPRPDAIKVASGRNMLKIANKKTSITSVIEVETLLNQMKN
jgi:hypothetical protein